MLLCTCDRKVCNSDKRGKEREKEKTDTYAPILKYKGTESAGLDSNSNKRLARFIRFNFNAVKPPEATPFHLGWFGAIIVRASRVYIDLQGHTIGMADAYRNQQRFFAMIELCNTPLPKGKGGFETEPISLDDIVVRNGRIESTSHHCSARCSGRCGGYAPMASWAI